LAYYHLPSILRGWCDLLRFCNGANIDADRLRKVFALEDYITIGHIEAMNKVIVLTGSIVGIAYSPNCSLPGMVKTRTNGMHSVRTGLNLFSPYGWSYWLMMFCNVVSPQMFWFKKLRRNIVFTFFMSIIVNVGMWFERFVIIVTSTYRDYLPSSWSTYYSPSIWEIGFYLGTFGLFFTCFFLFAKYFPVIAVCRDQEYFKTSGENYKDKMTDIEKADSEKFYRMKKWHMHTKKLIKFKG
jgi:hypothetical protein